MKTLLIILVAKKRYLNFSLYEIISNKSLSVWWWGVGGGVSVYVGCGWNSFVVVTYTLWFLILKGYLRRSWGIESRGRVWFIHLCQKDQMASALSLLLLIFLQASPHRRLEPVLPPAPYPSHSLHRLPQCPPVHLSRPIPVSLTLSLSPGPMQPRPPVPPPHVHVGARGSPLRGAPHHGSCRMVMVS